MKKFMVFIYPQGESIFNLPVETQKEHVRKVGAYLGQLKEKGHLLDAQPLQTSGTILLGKDAAFSEATLEETNISGFYALLAKDKESLIAVLKEDPRFEDTSWKLEIREVLEMM